MNPAAPEGETDASGLREALHRAFHDHWDSPTKPLDLYADSPLWQTQAAVVERIVAERLRVVEGERDAAMAETEMALRMHDVQWSRAESAEARLRAVEALADEWQQQDHWAIHRHRAAQRLRALIAGGGECGAIPPNVGGPVPCHLPRGHGDQHFSTSGCKGSEIRWTAAPEGETDASGLTERQVQDIAVTIAALLAGRIDGQQAVATTVAQIERIVAERLRVVEGERDAAQLALGEQADIEREAFGRGVEWASGAGMRQRWEATEARAESAEAAHAALVAGVAKIHGGTHWCHDSEGQGVVFEPGTEWWPCPTGALLAGGGE